jgi:hypothetical protein
MNKTTTKSKRSKKESSFKLPKYLRLAKGSMWFDTEGDQASGVKLFAMQKELVSRKMEMAVTHTIDGKEIKYPKATKIPEDEFNNENVLDFGKSDSSLPWYVDTSRIPPDKLSRILLAFKYGILVEADPDNPPLKKERDVKREFQVNDKGERVFHGKNTEMFKKLQNMNFKDLQAFVHNCPLTASARENLQDLYDYEQQGHNPLSRPRQEVIDLLKNKLREYGPGLSSIRINETE